MTDRKRFTLRMDGELFELIEERAKKNKRSVAKEIEFLLDQRLNEDDQEEKQNENK